MAPSPRQLSEAEKKVLLARGRDFVRYVRERVKGTSRAVMKRIVNEAVDEVRQRQEK